MTIPSEGTLPLINEFIGVQAGDEAVAMLQLSARWAERFGSPGDDMETLLARFRHVYAYIDAITHGVEPDQR
jgi:hypothetical protein